MRCTLVFFVGLSLFADSLPTQHKPVPPPTPREVAWRILSGVHLSVGKAQAYVQPYVMLHLAENTIQFNPKLALIEFRDAFSDARIMEITYRTPLQAQIVNSLAPVVSLPRLIWSAPFARTPPCISRGIVGTTPSKPSTLN